MSPTSLIRTGLCVLAITILLPWGTGRWLKTRRFHPVSTPVSLSVGHSEAIEFDTNVSGAYTVDFEVDNEISYRPVEPCSAHSWRDVHWTLYRFRGNAATKRYVWATNTDNTGDSLVIGFHGPSGKYRLEWNVPSEAACLDSGHPRLEISTPSEAYGLANNLLRLISLLFAGAGVTLVLRGAGTVLSGYLGRTQTLRMLPEFATRNVLPLRRHRPLPLITCLPHFPLILSGILFVPMLALIILETPLVPRGFLVHFGGAGTVVWEKSPWTETLSVYEDDHARLYVNGQLVATSKLSEKLSQELGKRMVWTVYFEADENARFADAAYAMDTIQELGAKVIWITPNVRQQLNRQVAK